MRRYVILFILTGLFATARSQTNDCKVLYKVEGKENAYPRFSKDAGRILFQSNNSGNWQLCMMDLKNGKQSAVMKDSFNNNFPDWSPDNAWITFVSDRDGNEEIYLVRPDGTELRRLTSDKSRDIHPYFSPDGRHILFNSTRGNGSLDIYRYTLATGSIKRITDSPDEETCARYSPDMKHIVLLRNNAASDDVFVFDPATSKYFNLTKTSTVEHGWPVYSADGKWIYFSSMESGAYCIYKITPDGSAKNQLTFAAKGEQDARVNVSKDGTRLLFNKRIGKTIEIRQCKTT